VQQRDFCDEGRPEVGGNENGTGLTRAGAADSAHGNPFEIFDRAQGTNEVSAAQSETSDQRLVTADARPLEII
jgi:hypothetical protein